jgi:centromeric protein E
MLIDFSFSVCASDHVFDVSTVTRTLFDSVAHPIIRDFMKGFNGTIFAYGQTSSG